MRQSQDGRPRDGCATGPGRRTTSECNTGRADDEPDTPPQRPAPHTGRAGCRGPDRVRHPGAGPGSRHHLPERADRHDGRGGPHRRGRGGARRRDRRGGKQHRDRADGRSRHPRCRPGGPDDDTRLLRAPRPLPLGGRHRGHHGEPQQPAHGAGGEHRRPGGRAAGEGRRDPGGRVDPGVGLRRHPARGPAPPQPARPRPGVDRTPHLHQPHLRPPGRGQHHGARHGGHYRRHTAAPRRCDPPRGRHRGTRRGARGDGRLDGHGHRAARDRRTETGRVQARRADLCRTGCDHHRHHRGDGRKRRRPSDGPAGGTPLAPGRDHGEQGRPRIPVTGGGRRLRLRLRRRSSEAGGHQDRPGRLQPGLHRLFHRTVPHALQRRSRVARLPRPQPGGPHGHGEGAAPVRLPDRHPRERRRRNRRHHPRLPRSPARLSP